jgi:hypothetical protein
LCSTWILRRFACPITQVKNAMKGETEGLFEIFGLFKALSSAAYSYTHYSCTFSCFQWPQLCFAYSLWCCLCSLWTWSGSKLNKFKKFM